MTSEQKNYKFKILSEDVANSDLFEDQTHERVCNNLFNIIQSSSKGVTIGLEGAWGSGKSTVISLLRKKFESQEADKTKIFMFDAWAHDGDPLRRIFLESLIRVIDNEENDPDLQRIKQKITGRKKTVEVKAKKSTSKLGKFLSLSALAIPLGSALLGKVNYANLVFPWSNNADSASFLLIFGLLFCLAPLWVLLAWSICGEKDHNKKISWEFFTTDTREDYTQDITEDGERTSIEFEDHFNSIISKAFDKNLMEKCIVVIDNLDRVAPDHAKNIWSTLQTFFQRRSKMQDQQIWADKLWFLIPYDHQGFMKIWDSSDSDNSLASSFIKKCFQIVIEVPMPVMSGWTKYAETVITESLYDWPEDARIDAIELYVRHAGNNLGHSPTPRDMKVFANQLGLLGSMWGPSNSTESKCLYVLLKEMYNSHVIRDKLIDSSLLKIFHIVNNEQNLLSEISGLLFGVSPTKGLELLLGPVIKNAFKIGDGSKLNELSKSHPQAFWIVYQATRNDWLPTMEHSDEIKVNFIGAIYFGLKSYPDKISREIASAKNVFIQSLGSFNLSRTKVSNTITQLLELNSGKEEIISGVSNWVNGLYAPLVSEIETDKFNQSRLIEISNILDILSTHGIVQKKLTYTKFSPTTWKIWLDSTEEAKVSFPNILPSKNVLTEISQEVGFSNPAINFESLSYLSKSFTLNPDSPHWAEIVPQLCSWFTYTNRQSLCEEAYDFALKIIKSRNEQAKNLITDCIKSPQFWATSSRSDCYENPSLPIIAALIFKIGLANSATVTNNVKEFWASEYAPNADYPIFEKIKLYDEFAAVWDLCSGVDNKKAIGFVRQTDDKLLFASSKGTFRLDELDWALEDELLDIAARLVKEGSFESNKNKMIGQQKNFASVYEILYKLKDNNVKNFIDAEVSRLNYDDWLTCLKESSPLITIVKSRNAAFSKALTTYLSDLINGRLEQKERLEPSDLITQLLSKAADVKVKLAPQLSNEYFSTEKDYINEDEFFLLQPLFSMNISKISQIQLMDKINQWLDNQDWKRIEWLMSQSFDPPKEPLESLVSRVQNYLDSENNEQQSIAIRLNEKLKLNMN